MSKLFTGALFFISFAPLWVSVIFVDVMSIVERTTSLWTEKISITTIVILFVIALLFVLKRLKIANQVEADRYIVRKVTEEKSITSEFLLSYILPLFAFDFTEWKSMILFLVFFFTLGFLCVKHDVFTVNVVLEIFHYQFYECDLEDEDGKENTWVVISKADLKGSIGDRIYLKALNNEYRLNLI